MYLFVSNCCSQSGPLTAAAIAAGAGSTAQQCLIGLLSSLLKYPAPDPELVALLPQEQQQMLAVMGSMDGIKATAHAAAALVGAAAAEPAAAASHVHVLPWLSLLGRSCCGLAAQLQTLQLPGALTTAELSKAGMSATQLLHQSQGSACVVQQMQASLLTYLNCSGVAEALQSAGYDMEAVLQQFAAAVAALEAVWDDEGPDGDSNKRARMVQLQGALQALGTTLCAACPVPQLCNNPSCGSLLGPSETHMVSGRSCVCGGCLTAHYCSKGCQKQHWKTQHKPVCQALQAAAAEAAAAAEGDGERQLER